MTVLKLRKKVSISSTVLGVGSGGDGKYIALRKVMMSEYPTVHSLMVEILITSGFRAEC
jgi:hypothetical protein